MRRRDQRAFCSGERKKPVAHRLRRSAVLLEQEVHIGRERMHHTGRGMSDTMMRLWLASSIRTPIWPGVWPVRSTMEITAGDVARAVDRLQARVEAHDLLSTS